MSLSRTHHRKTWYSPILSSPPTRAPLIDQPFRFTRGFIIVWAVLAVPTILLVRQMDHASWCEGPSMVLLGSLFATVVLYGPVLLIRQAKRSGRGWSKAIGFVLWLLTGVLIFFASLLLDAYAGHGAKLLKAPYFGALVGWFFWSEILSK